MRITSGEAAGRRLQAPAGQTTRPTSDKLRQAIFNILHHHRWSKPLIWENSQVADIFCGTGALALEALSNGMSGATLVDSHYHALQTAKTNAENLGYTPQCRWLTVDVRRLPPSPVAHHLLFLDPPYRQGLVAATLPRLHTGGWLADGALVVIETAPDETIEPPNADLMLQHSRAFGSSLVQFYQWLPART